MKLPSDRFELENRISRLKTALQPKQADDLSKKIRRIEAAWNAGAIRNNERFFALCDLVMEAERTLEPKKSVIPDIFSDWESEYEND